MNIKKKLESYWMLQKRIIPNLKFNQLFYEDFIRSFASETTTWLDAGCGHHILPSWRLSQECELVKRVNKVVGCDIDDSIRQHRTIRNRVVCNLEYLPFKNNSFNLVTTNMVVEHLSEPASVFLEFKRILIDQGVLIIHTPNLWSGLPFISKLIPQKIKNYFISKIEGRVENDIFPTKYRANTKKKIKKLLNTQGFMELKTSFLSSQAYFYFCLPIAFLELLWIKILMYRPFKRFREYICCAYAKQDK